MNTLNQGFYDSSNIPPSRGLYSQHTFDDDDDNEEDEEFFENAEEERRKNKHRQRLKKKQQVNAGKTYFAYTE